MNTKVQIKKTEEAKRLATKAAILDELVEFIEDKYLGYLMNATEKEKNISLAKAEKLLKE